MCKMERETIITYFSCNICDFGDEHELYPFGPLNKWVLHFTLLHFNDYKNEKNCHAKDCVKINNNLKEASIHYKNDHLKICSKCTKCRQTFMSIVAGKQHKKEGCGSYMRCFKCCLTIFGRSQIDFHKTGRCPLSVDGIGMPDFGDDAEGYSDVEN